MANKAISELPQAQNVNNQDLFVLEQSGIAKKLTAETFITEQGIIDALAEALDGHGGIQSVTLSSVSGRIRTYRITFTDQSATTFQVYDGTSIDRISRTSSSGLDDVYTVFLSDGTTTFFTVHNGADGTVSEAMLNDALKDKAPAITETTESSAIATFTDGADDMPLHNILAEINPVQDLTYGDPHPAGGGRNLFEAKNVGRTYNGVTYTLQDNGQIAMTGTASETSFLTAGVSANMLTEIPAGSYILSGALSVNIMLVATIYTVSGATATKIADIAQDMGSGATFTLSEDSWVGVNIRVQSGQATNTTIGIQIESGSTATSWTPYENICPITGWTGCNVTRIGANLYSRENGEYNVPVYSTDGSSASYPDVNAVWIPVKPNTTYTVASAGTESATFYVRWINCTDNKSFISRPGGTFSSTKLPQSFSTPSNCYWVEVAVNQYDIANLSKNDWEISVVATTDTTYEPYQGEEVTVDWTTEAGTVYGGTVDVATGLLTVDRAMVTYNSSSGFAAHTSGRWYHEGLPSGADTSKREEAISNQAIYWNSNNNYPYFSFGGSGVYVNKITADETIEQFSARLQANPMQICYFLATAQTYQLNPQQLMTLLGNNSVWTDVGNVSVTYPADTKMYIEKLTQPTEDDLVANQAITSGKYFMIGNSLYLALANIASGAAITIGTNAQRVSLADALNTINS